MQNLCKKKEKAHTHTKIPRTDKACRLHTRNNNSREKKQTKNKRIKKKTETKTYIL